MEFLTRLLSPSIPSAKIRDRLAKTEQQLETLAPRLEEARAAWKLAVIDGPEPQRAQRRKAMRELEVDLEELNIQRAALLEQLAQAETAEAAADQAADWDRIVARYRELQDVTLAHLAMYTRHAEAVVEVVKALKLVHEEGDRLAREAEAHGRLGELRELARDSVSPGRPRRRGPLHDVPALRELPCLEGDTPRVYNLFAEEHAARREERAAREREVEARRARARAEALAAREEAQRAAREENPGKWHLEQEVLRQEAAHLRALAKGHPDASVTVTVLDPPAPE